MQIKCLTNQRARDCNESEGVGRVPRFFGGSRVGGDGDGGLRQSLSGFFKGGHKRTRIRTENFESEPRILNQNREF